GGAHCARARRGRTGSGCARRLLRCRSETWTEELNAENPEGRMSSTSFLRYNPLRNRNTKLRPEISGKENQLMLRRTIFLISLLLCLCLFASVGPLQAQIPQTKQNPLIPGQGTKGTAGCSTTEASSCAEAAAKILPIVMGLSPLEENLRRLTDEIGGRVTGSPEMAKAVEWGVGAF